MCVKLLHINPLAIMFVRYNLSFLFVLPFIFSFSRRKYSQRRCSVLLHFIRAIALLVVNFLTYYGQQHASFFNANLIGMSEPLFTLIYAALLGWVPIKNWIKKANSNAIDQAFAPIPLTAIKTLGLIIGYSGVIVILGKNDVANINDNISNIGNLALIMANVIYACVLFLNRYMSLVENFKTILMYNGLFLCLMSFLIMPPLDFFCNLSYFEVFLLFIIGILGVSVNFFSLQASKHTKPDVYASLLYTRIIFSSFLGYFIFNEQLGLREIIGSVMIIIGCFFINKKSTFI